MVLTVGSAVVRVLALSAATKRVVSCILVFKNYFDVYFGRKEVWSYMVSSTGWMS